MDGTPEEENDMKYTEMLPTEMGTSKHTWNWFHAVRPGARTLHFTNGHILSLINPAELQWPRLDKLSENSPIHGTMRAVALDPQRPMELPKGVAQYWNSRGEPLHCERITERVGRPGQAHYRPGVVHMHTAAGQSITLLRHYRAFALRHWPGCVFRYNFTEAAPITVTAHGWPVALISRFRS